MVVLFYHHIGSPPSHVRYKRSYTLATHLRWHIELLKFMGFQFIRLSDCNNFNDWSNLAVLSFDDGFQDIRDEAFPVLQKQKVPGTVFVVTQDVGKKNLIWGEAGDQVCNDLMDWSDLDFLHNHGWEIGSHASQHVHLAHKTLVEQRQIISQSFDDLKDHLKILSPSFAYPYGSYTIDTVQILTELNCPVAVTTKSGVCDQSNSRLELNRIAVPGCKFHHLFRSSASLVKYAAF